MASPPFGSPSRPLPTEFRRKGKLKHVPLATSSEDGWTAVVRQSPRNSRGKRHRLNASQRGLVASMSSMSINSSHARSDKHAKALEDARSAYAQIIAGKPKGSRHVMREMILQYAETNAEHIAAQDPAVNGPNILLEMAPYIYTASNETGVTELKRLRAQYRAKLQADESTFITEKALKRHFQDRCCRKAICWGLGSMSEESTDRRDSLWQLALFEMIVDHCTTSRPGEKTPFIIQQDPIFSTTDKQFLTEIGHLVLPTPQGYEALSNSIYNADPDETILFAPHFNPLYFPHDLWLHPPAVIICNEITDDVIHRMPSASILATIQEMLEEEGEGDIIGRDVSVKDTVTKLFRGTPDHVSIYSKGELFVGPSACWEAHHELYYYTRRRHP